jgi:muramoyltetrapeptide carboxypeptidase
MNRTQHSALSTQHLIRPKPLLPSGRIAVLAASSPSEMPRIEEAKRHLERYGLTVTLAPNIASYGSRTYLAGTDAERAETLNRFLNSDEFDAFFFARGGYGAMRILDRIDYAAFRRNPRPVIGFSDVTALNQAIAIHAGVASFHGPMVNLDFFNGLSPEIERWFWSMLGGDAPLTHRFDASQVLREGDAEGILFGGCLSLTTALTSTPYDFWIDDGIWFWEDIDEPVYRIDRMLTHLRLSGRFDKIRGVIIGKLKGCGEDAPLVDLFRDSFGPSIPVVRDLPFGHLGDNLLMPIGAPVRLSTAEGTFTVMRAAVER